MAMALAGSHELASVLVPGGVTLPPREGEDAGKVQSMGARYSHGELSLEEAAELGCRACASPGGGCQFLGTAATSQVVVEALGMTLPHAALVPSGQPIWVTWPAARPGSSASPRRDHVPPDSHGCRDPQRHVRPRGLRWFHEPAAAHPGHRLHCRTGRPTVDDWHAVNLGVPRLVSVLPNGPYSHPTVRAYLAGGVPEVMLHLRALGLLELSVLTVTGEPLARSLDWWEASDRRKRLRERLFEEDHVDPDDVIMSPREPGSTG